MSAPPCATGQVGHATRADALDACEALMQAGHVAPGCHVMPVACVVCGAWHTRPQQIVDPDTPATWPGLMAGFAPAATDRTTTNSGDTGGPSLDNPKGV